MAKTMETDLDLLETDLDSVLATPAESTGAIALVNIAESSSDTNSKVVSTISDSTKNIESEDAENITVIKDVEASFLFQETNTDKVAPDCCTTPEHHVTIVQVTHETAKISGHEQDEALPKAHVTVEKLTHENLTLEIEVSQDPHQNHIFAETDPNEGANNCETEEASLQPNKAKEGDDEDEWCDAREEVTSPSLSEEGPSNNNTSTEKIAELPLETQLPLSIDVDEIATEAIETIVPTEEENYLQLKGQLLDESDKSVKPNQAIPTSESQLSNAITDEPVQLTMAASHEDSKEDNSNITKVPLPPVDCKTKQNVEEYPPVFETPEEKPRNSENSEKISLQEQTNPTDSTIHEAAAEQYNPSENVMEEGASVGSGHRGSDASVLTRRSSYVRGNSVCDQISNNDQSIVDYLSDINDGVMNFLA